MPKLTNRTVDRLRTDEPNGSIVWDDAIPGFGVRVRPSGRRTYLVQYRNQAGRTRRYTLGVHGALTPSAARDLARQSLAKVARGEDPAEEAAQRKSAPTVADLAEDYLARHAVPYKRASSVENDRSMLARHILPKLGRRKVEAVRRRDVEVLYQSLRATPYCANRVLSLLGKMFSLAVAWGWRADNPTRGVERFQEHKRERWVSGEDLERLVQAIEKHPNQRAAKALLLMLLTGARRGEVLSATWDQFDLEQGSWTKPAHVTKQKRPEHFPLSPAAIDLLQGIKGDQATKFLFPGDVPGRPLRNIKRVWRRVCRDAGLEGLRIHDLRHTFASHLVSGGESLYIVGRLLGHTQVATTQRYAHLADDPLREASDRFGRRISSALEKTADAQVIPLRR